MKLTERLAKFGADKWMHITASLVLANITTRVLRRCGAGCLLSAIVGFGVSLAVGIGKECYDKFKQKETFDWGDIKADIVGAACGSAIGMV